MKVDFGDYDTSDLGVWLVVSKSPIEDEIKVEVCYDLEEGVERTPFFMNSKQLMRFVAGLLVTAERDDQ